MHRHSTSKADVTFETTGRFILIHPCSPKAAQWIARNSTTNVADTIFYSPARGEEIVRQMRGDGLMVKG